MEFVFEVGQDERHHVRYSFDKMKGDVAIDVDGESVVRARHLYSVFTGLVRRERFTVGVEERHEVVIEKRRPLFFAGFRPQRCQVLVDGRVLTSYEG